MHSEPSRRQITHERIVTTAARAIRRTGFHGLGVANIMKESGLTHGGFYAHFASRDALLVEALTHAGQDVEANMAKGAIARQARGASAFQALVEGYLSVLHLTSTEGGCPVAALVSEMPRQAPEVREAAVQRVRSLVSMVQRTLRPDAAANSAVVIASQLVGALQMARALGDNAEGKALLAATRRTLLAQHDLTPRK
jgi:TetR/AcrR family transcriptional regulator, transcriptional repressor for nem operon